MRESIGNDPEIEVLENNQLDSSENDLPTVKNKKSEKIDVKSDKLANMSEHEDLGESASAENEKIKTKKRRKKPTDVRPESAAIIAEKGEVGSYGNFNEKRLKEIRGKINEVGRVFTMIEVSANVLEHRRRELVTRRGELEALEKEQSQSGFIKSLFKGRALREMVSEAKDSIVKIEREIEVLEESLEKNLRKAKEDFSIEL